MPQDGGKIEAVNARIKEVRMALKLSQAQFCKGIPLTSGHYAGIELGQRRVNRRIIRLLNASYGVSEHFLATGEGEMFDGSDPRLEELIRIFQDLPRDFQDFVLHEIAELKKLRLRRGLEWEEGEEEGVGGEGEGKEGIFNRKVEEVEEGGVGRRE